MKYGKIIAGISLLWSFSMTACTDSSSDAPMDVPEDKGPSLEEILAEYTVAYEFDDTADIGKDYFGKNNAVVNDSLPALNVKNGSLVLEGNSGLRVHLSDDFKKETFAIEVRFMATGTLPLSNIFSADPPGDGVSGWMLRLDGLNLDFHFRHGSDKWNVVSAGEISLNEWHVARVEFDHADVGSLTVEAYELKLFLDGKVVDTKTLYSDAVDLKFDLGIGYDPHHQSRYDERFFIGKIDYIRFKG